ncbi:MAG: S1 family peptidase [Bradymonadia bacterium]
MSWANALLALFMAGCTLLDTGGSGGSNCEDGSEGCACYGNNTCDEGLACDEGQCVDVNDLDPEFEGRIVGGQTSRSFAATGVLMYQGQSWCTATLTDPSTILTAAHCVDMLSGPRDGNLSFVIGSEPLQPSASSAISAIHIHPEWLGFPPNGGDLRQFEHGRDLAVLRLTTPINSVAPVRLWFGPAEQLIGQNMILVGYGASQVVNDMPIGGGIRRRTQVTISATIAQGIRYEDARTGSCRGDSGGPAFMEIDGVWRQVGVTSYGDAQCAFLGTYQRLDLHQDWLAQMGVVDNGRSLTCDEDEMCDGQCPDDPDCWTLLCPGGSCAAPSGECLSDGTCDPSCGDIDPDCGYDQPAQDPCQLYSLYGNGYCDLYCPQPDPDCQTQPGGAQTCGQGGIGFHPPTRQCVYLDLNGQQCWAEPYAFWQANQFAGRCEYFDRSGNFCGAAPPWCDGWGCYCQ